MRLGIKDPTLLSIQANSWKVSSIQECRPNPNILSVPQMDGFSGSSMMVDLLM